MGNLLLVLLLCLAPLTIKADDHWGELPPTPELHVFHFPQMGLIEISFISDSTLDRPVWYILEVKQQGDPNADWHRPFNPLQESNFNERVTLNLRYRNAVGQLYPWFRAEMVRIRVLWGA